MATLIQVINDQPVRKKLIVATSVYLLTLTAAYFLVQYFNEKEAVADAENTEQQTELNADLPVDKSKLVEDKEYYQNQRKRSMVESPDKDVISITEQKKEDNEFEDKMSRYMEQRQAAKKRSSSITPPPTKSYQRSEPKTQSLSEEEAYRQQLIEGKKEMLKHYEQSNKQYQNSTASASPEKEVVEFRASIYEDQYILPGDRVKLVLNNDLIYDNKRFVKGTFIYAFAGMGRSRVLLEVDNIAHIPIKLVAKDITDGRTGLYSTRAGELWLEYKDEFNNDIGQDAANAGTEVSGSSLVGSALKGLANFFKKKKIRKRDKILLTNNQEVILTNKIDQ